MATTTISSAPWRPSFEEHLNKNSSSEFLVSTVGYDAQIRPVPRSRVCGFRGFFPNPDLHSSAVEALKEQEPEGGNPQVYESDMISFTTDVRMEKVGELASSANVVEGVFWLKDVMNQWRVKGSAFVIGGPEGGKAEDEARKEIQKGLRVRGDGAEVDKWTWERQVTTYFANHTPILRGSFKNPAPGQPRSRVSSDQNIQLGQKVTDLHDTVARHNFRVVVIRPEEVERLDLADYENPRRWKWTWDEQQGRWEEVELWP